MANSQNNLNDIDLLSKISDLDELLMLVCGAANDDVCIRGLTISLMQAKKMSAEIRDLVTRLNTD